MNDHLKAEAVRALQYIDADDRDTWVRMAFAVKHMFGDDGFEIWDEWSQTSDRYQRGPALATWRSAKMNGGITGGTLFFLAGNFGYVRDEQVVPKISKRTFTSEQAEHKRVMQNAAAEASQKATARVNEAIREVHPYLAAKGFPQKQGLVDWKDGNTYLLIPMRDRHEHIVGLQQIDQDGRKLFWPRGMRAGGAAYRIGVKKPKARLYCEGYATGLSIYKALLKLNQRQAQVIVTFSAHNLRKVVIEERRGGIELAVADHDLWTCKSCERRWSAPLDIAACSGCGETEKLLPPAGQYQAHQSGIDWWAPPIYGDANDYQQEYGAAKLAYALHDAMKNNAYGKKIDAMNLDLISGLSELIKSNENGLSSP